MEPARPKDGIEALDTAIGILLDARKDQARHRLGLASIEMRHQGFEKLGLRTKHKKKEQRAQKHRNPRPGKLKRNKK